MNASFKLEGALGFPSAREAAAAFDAMMNLARNELSEGARLAGDTIVFTLEADAAARTNAIRGVASALESATSGSVTCSEARGTERWDALGRDFWARRWSDGQIGFHEGRCNTFLAAHVGAFESVFPRARILVPLSGKAFDLRWLAERGHDVVGIELVETAVRAFFEEQNVAPEVVKLGRHKALRAGGVTLVCGDFFDVADDTMGHFDVVYDRAALIALLPSARVRYVERCQRLLGPGGLTFLVTIAYASSLASGPPWSVDGSTVKELYHPRGVTTLETREAPTTGRLAQAGIASLTESAYLIR